jgi:hypothetical protein
MGASRPPLDYLTTCSQTPLESVELSLLNLAANPREEFLEILDEWIESEVDARLARSILEWRRNTRERLPPRATNPPPTYPSTHELRWRRLFVGGAVSPLQKRGRPLQTCRRFLATNALHGGKANYAWRHDVLLEGAAGDSATTEAAVAWDFRLRRDQRLRCEA